MGEQRCDRLPKSVFLCSGNKCFFLRGDYSKRPISLAARAKSRRTERVPGGYDKAHTCRKCREHTKKRVSLGLCQQFLFTVTTVWLKGD